MSAFLVDCSAESAVAVACTDEATTAGDCAAAPDLLLLVAFDISRMAAALLNAPPLLLVPVTTGRC